MPHAKRTSQSCLSICMMMALVACDGDGNRGAQAVASGPDDEAALARACGTAPDQVVVINDFAYAPRDITVNVGDTVAWINMEFCGDFAPEQAAIPMTGCDSHHQVVTITMSGSEGIDSGPICSPNRGIEGPPGGSGPEVDPASCADERASNVFCHTFTEADVESYTCFTNPGHTAVMGGSITILP